MRQLAEEPADLWDGVASGDAPHLSVNRPLLGHDDRFALQGWSGGRPLATAIHFFFLNHNWESLRLLTADVHVEDVADGRVVVIGGEGVDPALRAEDPHQSELADVPDKDDR